MKSESFIPLLIIAFLILFSGKGGDSPSPSPDQDVLAAKQAGERYLSGLADLYESYELPENPAEFGEPFHAEVMEVHHDSFAPLDEIMSKREYPGEAKTTLKRFATGLREAAQ